MEEGIGRVKGWSGGGGYDKCAEMVGFPVLGLI